MAITRDTIRDYYSEQSYSILKYFLYPLSRLSEEEFRQVVYKKHQIDDIKLNEQNREKINRVVDEVYKNI